MRLGLRLLNVEASVNKFEYVDQIRIARGETLDLCFRLVDEEQEALRYVPSSAAAVQFLILRSDEVMAAPLNTRIKVNNGIDRPAVPAWDGDRSCWKVILTSADTEKMVSGSIKVVVTDGSSKKIASLTQAIKIIDGMDE